MAEIIIAPRVDVGKKENVEQGPHGARVAADVHNPSGIIINGKYKEYETPEEGVADTQNRLTNYIKGKGLMKDVKPTLNNIVGMWVNGKPGTGSKVGNGAYVEVVQNELANMGYDIGLHDEVPLEAVNALTRGIIKNEAGPNADMFLGDSSASPFDYEMTSNNENLDTGIFGDTEPLPPHIENWNAQPTEKSLKDVVLDKFGETTGYVLDNPLAVLPGVASGAIQKYGTMPDMAERKASPFEQSRAKMAPDSNARVMQGSVEDGMTGRARQGYNDITSLRSKQANQSQAILEDLYRQGRVSPSDTSRIISQSGINTATPSGVLAPQEAIDDIARRLHEEAIGRPKEPIVKRVLGGVKSIPSKLVDFSSRYPMITNTLSGVGAGLSAREFAERKEEGDYPGAAVAGFNTLASGLGAIPALPPTNPLSAGLDVAKGAGMFGELVGLPLELAYKKWRSAHPLPSAVKDYSEKKKPKELKKADGGSIPLSLRHVYFHRKARGGSV